MPDAVPTTPPLVPPPSRRVWFSIGPVGITTARALLVLAVAATLVAVAIGWKRVDLDQWHARAEALPGWMVFLTISVLPLAGVPVAMLHVVAGVRFGIVGGLWVVAGTTVLHHICGYLLVRLAPRMFARNLASWRQRFPRGAHGPVTVFSCLLPGMPYAVQLYLLPVLGVPLRILLLISAPLHTLRAIVSVIGGDFSADLTPGRVAALIGYYALLTLVCALAFRRVRHALRAPPPAGAGR